MLRNCASGALPVAMSKRSLLPLGGNASHLQASLATRCRELPPPPSQEPPSASLASQAAQRALAPHPATPIPLGGISGASYSPAINVIVSLISELCMFV